MQGISVFADQLAAQAGGKLLFQNLSFQANGGQTVALIGQSGAGKTTLLNLLGLLDQPSKGKILINGENANSWPTRKREKFWREKAAFLYQDAGIIDGESLLYNVSLTKAKKSQEQALHYLKMLGLAQAHEKAAVLSGGEKRRLGLARLLYKGGRVIYADEPTASLDAANRQLVTDLLLKQAQAGALVFIATHDEALAKKCDTRICLGE
ncbi:ATP-binding cassette domain-containing protein [Lactobacillus porci]|uniref:ATP-binding cassette domain-containing protein n=1 Tax=Lactobacillus porci TaxID=2012477 RepID=UPI0039915EFD